MNDLDLCLEIVSRSCQPLCYICHWISRKPLEIEAWFQRTTNRKWPVGYQMVTWPMTSHDHKRSNCWPQYACRAISQRDVRAYTRSTSRSLASEQNKSAVTDHSISLNYVIDWDQAKVIDREGNKGDRWIKEAIHIRKEQDKSMNRDEGSYQLSHIYDNLFAPNLSGERRLDRPFRRRPPSRPKRQL